MTDEERQRTINFLLEHQARMDASVGRQEEQLRRHKEELQRLKKARIRERPRLIQLQKSFEILVQLSKNNDDRMDGLDASTAALQRKTSSLDEAYNTLARLVEKNIARLEKLESCS